MNTACGDHELDGLSEIVTCSASFRIARAIILGIVIVPITLAGDQGE
jgi:hypothetical protein